jgi:hypothetical protein
MLTLYFVNKHISELFMIQRKLLLSYVFDYKKTGVR